jgi:hypothetical protein
LLFAPTDAMPVTKIRSYGSNSNSKDKYLPPIPRDLNLDPVDDVVRRLCRLCWLVDKPQTTGKLIQLGIQIGETKTGKIKDNMYLNQVPHNRYVRKYFYEMAAEATLEAVTLCSQGKISNRMKITSMFPEMNPSMDSYRIGTILEMTRAIAIRLVEQNLRVRVCVQGTMVGFVRNQYLMHVFNLLFFEANLVSFHFERGLAFLRVYQNS